MTLSVGARLGPYEIEAPIGAGGMGEVYKARDTRLERTVAIKVLPSHLASDTALRERFEREARAISSLNHPHICTLHDVGHQDGVDYLVMEYVEGETLAERLKRGPLPPEQVLRHAVEIADALDRAHKQGIVHRDLKPGNVMLTKPGAKLMDFGLAKQHGAGAAALVSTLPTESRNLTAEGTILGTFQYMAPEQLEGKEADARTDIFAFGALLYEMATGKRAFTGKSQASLIAAILGADPPPISTLAPMSPPAFDRVVRVCLAKEPDERWQSAHDLLAELKWIAEGGSQAGVSAPVAARRRLRERVVVGLVGVAVGAAVAVVAVRLLPRERSPRSVARFALTLPPGSPLAGSDMPLLALSPDGTRLVYVATREGSTQLFLRKLDELTATPIRGTEGGTGPFFSPDGEWIGFFARGKLKKVAVTGGTTLTLCDAPQLRGASWGPDDTIVFNPEPGKGLHRVSAAGGTPEVLTTLDPARNERSHRWPEFLPGGKAVLFAAEPTSPTFDNSMIEVLSLGIRERKVVHRGGSSPRYAPTGHLLFARPGAVLAVPFDPRRLAVTGNPAPVIEGVMTAAVASSRAAQYVVSASGTLAFVPGTQEETERNLVWVDRKGKEQPIPAPPRGYDQARLSPDGKKIAVHILESATNDVWVYDLSGGTLTRLTFGPQDDETPAWMPDGRRVTYGSNRPGPQPRTLFSKPADGSGQEEALWQGQPHLHLGAWSPDGRTLVTAEPGAGDLVVVSLDKSAGARTLKQTPFRERAPAFSPDGRWLTYGSDETGREEIYVEAFPGPGGRWQISTEGGREPVWARNGRELFYRTGDRLMAVPVSTAPAFSAGTPNRLFEGRYLLGGIDTRYDVSPDGQRFLMIKGPGEAASTQITLVLDWFQELTRQVPPGGRGAK